MPLIVGIDLGSFQSALVTSTGTLVQDRTVIGRLRDETASIFLGSSVFHGQQAIDRRVNLNLVQPLTQERHSGELVANRGLVGEWLEFLLRQASDDPEELAA